MSGTPKDKKKGQQGKTDGQQPGFSFDELKPQTDEISDNQSVVSSDEDLDDPNASAGMGFSVEAGSPSDNPQPGFSVTAEPPDDDIQPGFSLTAESPTSGNLQPGIRISATNNNAPDGVVLDLEGEDLGSTEQEEIKELHKKTTDLRLQKIYQHDKYNTPSTVSLNEEFFGQLYKLLEEENKKFKDLPPEYNDPTTRPHKIDSNGNRKYSEQQETEFDIAGRSLHQALNINNIDEKNFEIKYKAKVRSSDYNSTVKVSFQEEEGSSKKIAITGKQDNISIMLLAAITAKEKLGNNARYYIYSSKNIEGLAELFARAEIYGLNPEPLKKIGQTDEEFNEFQQLVNSDAFKEKIETYKNKYRLSEEHKPNPSYKALDASHTDDSPNDESKSSPSTTGMPTLLRKRPKPD